MKGSYRMADQNGEQFDVPILQFKLVANDFLN